MKNQLKHLFHIVCAQLTVHEWHTDNPPPINFGMPYEQLVAFTKQITDRLTGFVNNFKANIDIRRLTSQCKLIMIINPAGAVLGKPHQMFDAITVSVIASNI